MLDSGLLYEADKKYFRRIAEADDMLQSTRKQIEEKQYDAYLLQKGIPAENIRKYGFAFEGKTVLIG